MNGNYSMMNEGVRVVDRGGAARNGGLRNAGCDARHVHLTEEASEVYNENNTTQAWRAYRQLTDRPL